MDLLSDLDPFCYRGTECEFKFHRILRISSLEGLSEKPQERFGITVKTQGDTLLNVLSIPSDISGSI